MPDTALAICNRALQLVGAPAVSSLSDTTDPNAVYMNTLYNTTLDDVLASHEWNFANIRVSLAGLGMACTPAWGFSCMFGLPCTPYLLRVLEVSLDGDENVDQADPWRIETWFNAAGTSCSRVILTNSCDVSMLYVGRVDASVFDVMFAEALTYELASKAAYPITRNATLIDGLVRIAQTKWQKARVRDSQEGRKKNSVLSTVLTRVR